MPLTPPGQVAPLGALLQWRSETEVGAPRFVDKQRSQPGLLFVVPGSGLVSMDRDACMLTGGGRSGAPARTFSLLGPR
jgi:hypothetical protein